MKKLLLTGIAGLFLASPALAQNSGDKLEFIETPVITAHANTSVEGTYAGTFLCAAGEMGMSLALIDGGSMEQQCRKVGRCNDGDPNRGKYRLSGVLNFFPTISNPRAPSGAFEVSGYARYRGQTIVRVFLEPGNWVDQPENFGASGLEATLINNHMSGKPTAKNCLRLNLTKLHTPVRPQ